MLRPAPSRKQTSNANAMHLSPHPKPGISVEEWESKAPLGEVELRSIAAVKAASEHLPLPLKFSARDEGDGGSESGPSQPGTPMTRARALLGGPGGGISRPSTPNLIKSGLGTGTGKTHTLQPSEPIQTAQAFYDWSALVDRAVAHEQEAEFRVRLTEVADRLGECDKLADNLDVVNAEVESMLAEWRSVEASGESLKGACERLLAERDRLMELTDDLEFRLEYFQELGRAAQMLNHPGESLVLQTDFIYMVERVDICIDFLRNHRHYKESEVYLLRFQQCMTRAMSLIKMFFVGSLRALTSDISRRLVDKDISATAQHHLLYTRFTSVSHQVRPLLGELERRAKLHPNELAALRDECTGAYMAARRQLLHARVVDEIRGLDPGRTEIVELTRAGCSYLKQLCTDEFNLYRSFFGSGEDQLYEYLEKLCDLLYDDLRPRILHEQRLTALCEVCTVLQALMVLDVSRSGADTSSSAESDDNDDDGDGTQDDDEDDEGDTELTTSLYGDKEKSKSRGDGLRQLQISRLLQMVLQDAQTRLFFKAQSVIQSEIRYYVPKQEDLAYPDKIVDARKPTGENNLREKESVSELFRLTSREKEETWYPTLRKTVWVLSQLHDFVQPAIFEDIAQESLGLCRLSLVTAAETIKTRNPPQSVLDGDLFLVRHLFILKEITHSLDLVQKADASSSSMSAEMAGVAGGGMTEALASVLNRTTALLPSAFFASLGMPRADENIGDAKLGIDQELKRSCESMITYCVEIVARPLRDWVARVNIYRNPLKSTKPGLSVNTASDSTKEKDKGLEGQEWANQTSAESIESAFRAACERDLRYAAARFTLYLEDPRTVSVLLGHAQERVTDEYVGFSEVARSLHPGLAGQFMSGHELGSMLRRICEVDAEK